MKAICECGWEGDVKDMDEYRTAMDGIVVADKCPKCGANNVDQVIPPIKYVEE